MTLKSAGRADFAQVSINQFFDRNPLTVVNNYVVNSIAPHANTNRWSYTVPANRKFSLGTIMAHIVRDSVATAAGYSAAQIYVNGKQILVVVFFNVAVDTNRFGTVGGGTVLVAGDIISGNTSDTSTNGTVDYNLSMIGTEFDA